MWLKILVHQCIVIYCFPIQYWLRKSSISIQASSGPRPPAVPRLMPINPHLQQLQAPRPRPRSRVGGWCVVETLSELRRQEPDVWHTGLSETVNSQQNQSHPGCCTVCLWVALSSREGGGHCQCFTPLCLAGGRKSRGYVYVYVRQKCTMQSQKQWHFLSLPMVALFYN